METNLSNKKTFIFKFLAILLSVMVVGCLDKKGETNKLIIDDYYTRGTGWDYQRIPLVKPFELVKMKKNDSWSLNTHELPNYASDISPIKLINISEKYIFGYKKQYQSSNLPQFKTPEKWFILDVGRNKLLVYDSEKRFKATLSKKGIEFVLFDPFEIQRTFKEERILPWFPREVQDSLRLKYFPDPN